MPTTEGGFFSGQSDEQHQGTQDTPAWYQPHVLDFNWARTQDELETTQYRYLANTVFENYSMHLEARRESSMHRTQFLTCLWLLYTDMSADAEEVHELLGSGPGQDGHKSKPAKQQSPSSQGSYQAPHETSEHGVGVTLPQGASELHTLRGSAPGQDGNYSKPLKQESPSSQGSHPALHHTSEHSVAVKLEHGASELHTLRGSAPGQDGNYSKPLKQESPWSQGSHPALHHTSEHSVAVKLEEGPEQYFETGTFSMPNAALHPTPQHMHVNLRAGTYASSSAVLVGTPARVDEPEQDPTVMSQDDKYREKREELQRLVSTVLYLTEMYGVAQTRGGAQVSQYRRTLTAQSHTLLVQRLARELQQTEAGFWAWLDRRRTPPAQV